MSGVIKDGATGNTAQVDSRNRLRTFSTAQSAATAASIGGDTFFITHDVINLSSDNESFIFHLENNDTLDWIVNLLQFVFGPSTDGTGDFRTKVVRNPTGGTLITAGTEVEAINMNIGSPAPLSGTFLVGVDGSTSTGGDANPAVLIPAAPTAVELNSGPIVIPPGTSVNLSVTPPSGNISINAQVTLIINRNEA